MTARSVFGALDRPFRTLVYDHHGGNGGSGLNKSNHHPTLFRSPGKGFETPWPCKQPGTELAAGSQRSEPSGPADLNA